VPNQITTEQEEIFERALVHHEHPHERGMIQTPQAGKASAMAAAANGSTSTEVVIVARYGPHPPGPTR
jgi:hypothetical protein